MKQAKKKARGVNVTVSPKAHSVMSKKGFESKPRKSHREIINELNGLPKEL